MTTYRQCTTRTARLSALLKAIAILAICNVLILGCNVDCTNRNNDLDLAAQNSTADTTSSTDNIDDKSSHNPFVDADWDALNKPVSGELARPVAFEVGDLVPCSDDQSEFVLEINAMSGDDCFYRRQHGFRRYKDRSGDPSKEAGMTEETLVCATLVGGSASGTFQYADLGPESVTVRIHWNVSRGEREEEFVGEFTPGIDESGRADAGKGNVFNWSFRRRD